MNLENTSLPAQFPERHPEAEFKVVYESLLEGNSTGLKPNQSTSTIYSDINGKVLVVTITGDAEGSAYATVEFDGVSVAQISSASLSTQLPDLVNSLDEKANITNIDERSRQLAAILEFRYGFKDHGVESPYITSRVEVGGERKQLSIYHSRWQPEINGQIYEGESRAPFLVAIRSDKDPEVIAASSSDINLLLNELITPSEGFDEILSMIAQDGYLPLRKFKEPHVPNRYARKAFSLSGPNEERWFISIDVALSEQDKFVTTLKTEIPNVESDNRSISITTDYDPRDVLHGFIEQRDERKVTDVTELLWNLINNDPGLPSSIDIYDGIDTETGDPRRLSSYSVNDNSIIFVDDRGGSTVLCDKHARHTYCDALLVEVIGHRLLMVDSLYDYDLQGRAVDFQDINNRWTQGLQGVPDRLRALNVEILQSTPQDTETRYSVSFIAEQGGNNLYRFSAILDDAELNPQMGEFDKRDSIVAKLATKYREVFQDESTTDKTGAFILAMGLESSSINRARFEYNGNSVNIEDGKIIWHEIESESAAIKTLTFSKESSDYTAGVKNLLEGMRDDETTADILTKLQENEIRDYELAITAPEDASQNKIKAKFKYDLENEEYVITLDGLGGEPSTIKFNEAGFPGALKVIEAIERDCCSDDESNYHELVAVLAQEDVYSVLKEINLEIDCGFDKQVLVTKEDQSDTTKVVLKLGGDEVALEVELENEHAFRMLSNFATVELKDENTLENIIIKYFIENTARFESFSINRAKFEYKGNSVDIDNGKIVWHEIESESAAIKTLTFSKESSDYTAGVKTLLEGLRDDETTVGILTKLQENEIRDYELTITAPEDASQNKIKAKFKYDPENEEYVITLDGLGGQPSTIKFNEAEFAGALKVVEAIERDCRRDDGSNYHELVAVLAQEDVLSALKEINLEIACGFNKKVLVTKEDQSDTTKVVLKLHGNEITLEAELEDEHAFRMLSNFPTVESKDKNTLEKYIARYFNNNVARFKSLKIGCTPERSLDLEIQNNAGVVSVDSSLIISSVGVQWNIADALNGTVLSEQHLDEMIDGVVGAVSKTVDSKIMQVALLVFGKDKTRSITFDGEEVLKFENDSIGIEHDNCVTKLTLTNDSDDTVVTPEQIYKQMADDVISGLFENRNGSDFRSFLLDRVFDKLVGREDANISIKGMLVNVTSNGSIGAWVVVKQDDKVLLSWDSEVMRGNVTLNGDSQGLPYVLTRNFVQNLDDLIVSSDKPDGLLALMCQEENRISEIDVSLQSSEGRYAIRFSQPFRLHIRKDLTNSDNIISYESDNTTKDIRSPSLIEGLNELRSHVEMVRINKPNLIGIDVHDIDQLFDKKGGVLELNSNYASYGYSKIELRENDDKSFTLILDGGDQYITCSRNKLVDLREALKKELFERGTDYNDAGRGALLAFVADPTVVSFDLSVCMADVGKNGYERVVHVKRDNENAPMLITMFREGYRKVFSGKLIPAALNDHHMAQRDVLGILTDPQSYGRSVEERFKYDVSMVTLLSTAHMNIDLADLVLKAGCNESGQRVYGDAYVRMERDTNSGKTTVKVSHVGRNVLDPNNTEEFRRLSSVGEYEQLEEAFNRSTESGDKLSIFEVSASFGISKVLKSINGQAGIKGDNKSVASMLSDISLLSRGIQDQELKILQLWMVLNPPLDPPGGDVPGAIERNQEIYIIADQGKEYQMFIDGTIDGSRVGRPGQDFRIRDLYTSVSKGGLAEEFGITAIYDGSDQRKLGHMWALGSDAMGTIGKFFNIVQTEQIAGTMPYQEMAARGNVLLSQVVFNQRALNYDPDEARDPINYPNAARSLVNDIGLVLFQMKEKGELHGYFIPVGHRDGRRVGRCALASNTPDLLHRDPVVMRMVAINPGTLGSVRTMFADLDRLAEQSNQRDNVELARNWIDNISSSFRTLKESFAVGKDIGGNERIVAENRGSEVESVTFEEVLVGGSARYYDITLDLNTFDTDEDGGRTGSSNGPRSKNRGQVKMRLDKVNELTLAELRNRVMDESKLSGDYRSTRIMSDIIKAGGQFISIDEGVEVRLHQSVVRSNEVAHAFARLNSADAAERFKGAVILYNVERDFVRVDLASVQESDQRGRKYNLHFEVNTLDAKRSYLAYEKIFQDPSQAIGNALVLFGSLSGSSGERVGQDGIQRTRLYIYNKTPIGGELISAMCSGLNVKGRNIVTQMAMGVGALNKKTTFDNVDIKDSIIDLHHQEYGNPDRLAWEYMQLLLYRLCDSVSGDREPTGNAVDFTIEGSVPHLLPLVNIRFNGNVDVLSGKTGSHFSGMFINCEMDRLRIGHRTKVNSCEGLVVSGCTIGELYIGSQSGLGFSNKLVNNKLGTVILDAPRVGLDMRNSSFSELIVPCVSDILSAPQSSRAELAKVRAAMAGFTYAYNYWGVGIHGERNLSMEQARARNALKLGSENFAKMWFKDVIDGRGERSYIMSADDVVKALSTLHKSTATRDPKDSSLFAFSNGFVLRFFTPDANEMFGIQTWGPLGVMAPRIDRIGVEVVGSPNGIEGPKGRFYVKADIIMEDLQALATQTIRSRKSDEENEAHGAFNDIIMGWSRRQYRRSAGLGAN
jgi:hypothetical protein